MIYRLLLPLFLFPVLLFSCRENPGADPAAVRQELRQREIVHLSQGQITERAAEMGDSLLLRADEAFLQLLKSRKDLRSCQPAWDSASALLSKKYQADLRRLPFSSEAVKRLKNQKEVELFEAGRYSHEKHLPMGSSLQKDGDKEFIYASALVLQNEACTSCHRQSAVPAIQGEAGDTIGLRLLRFSRRQVVMSFVE